MDEIAIQINIMSGVEDGTVLDFTSEGDGSVTTEGWTVAIGRREENDVCLRNDTYISRFHALVHFRSGHWWLEDCNSKNGTFVEDGDDDARVIGTIALEAGQFFRVGRTWLRLEHH